MTNPTQFTRYVLATAAVTALAISPILAHAQIVIMSTGNGAVIMGQGTPPSDTSANAAKAAGLTADSLTVLHKLALSKKAPIIIINDSVTTAKSFNALPLARIASIQFQEASEGDIKFYGPKAENGIWTVQIKAPEPKNKTKPPKKK